MANAGQKDRMNSQSAPQVSRRSLLAAGGVAAITAVLTQTRGEAIEMTKNQTGAAQQGVYDAIMIGGSFAGLSAAMQLARARRRVLVIDGGKPRNRFAPTSHGFFGQDGKTPREIMDTARRQLLAYPTVAFQAADATDATQEKQEKADGGEYRVAFGDGHEARARRLVLATGVVDHLPDVPGLRELWGDGVAHCPYCHGYEVAGRNLAVLLGAVGADVAVHQATLLKDWSDNVTLLTNGAPGLTPEHRDRLHARGVKVDEARLARLLPDREGGRGLGAAEFADGRRVPFGGLFTAPRVSLASPLAQRLGCEIEQGALGPMVKTNALKETSVSGVYAAGDAARAMHNATWASADGVTAGASAHQSLVAAKTPH